MWRQQIGHQLCPALGQNQTLAACSRRVCAPGWGGYEWLEAHFPDRKRRVLALLREARRGRLYDPAFGTRMTGEGVYAQLLARRFERACQRLNLGGKEWDLDVSQFEKPRLHGEQLALF